MAEMIGKILSRRRRKTPRCAAVIVGAGTSSRMGGTDKLTAPLGGEKLIVHTLRAFDASAYIDEIILVTRPDRLEEMSAAAAHAGIRKISKVVPGGDTRLESSLAGVNAVSRETKLIAIHDGARPLVTDEVIARCVKRAAQTGAAIPVIPVNDTLKVVSASTVRGSIDRATAAAVQTPQVFDADLIKAALIKACKDGAGITDDSSAVQRMGGTVSAVEGSRENIKVTTPLDLIIAEAVLKEREE